MRVSTLITLPTRVAIAAILLTTCSAWSANASSSPGTVQSGGSLLAGVEVTLFEATERQPIVIGKATTDDFGQFAIPSPNESSSSIFFTTADIGFGVQFVTILGPNLPSTTTINELTTVAAAYSMAQFYRTGVISGNSFGLRLAAGMNDNIVSRMTGESSPVLLTSPNADQTNSLRSTRSLANLLVASVDHFLFRLLLLELTKTPDGSRPENTAQALANLARNPGQNVRWLYWLSKFRDSYSPALFKRPDAWTVTVKVNDSGDDQFLFGGPANVVFDSNGYGWVANNVMQGTGTSALDIMVLKPNGQPADGLNGTPTSPISAGGILGVGLGISIDPFGSVWIGNFGWGGDNPTTDGNGSVTQLSPLGLPISGPLGYQGGPLRVQGTASDDDGNIWLCSFGNDSVYVFPNGDPDESVGFLEYEGSKPFDNHVAPDGSVWVTNGGGLAGQNPSSVAKFKFVNGKLKRKVLTYVGMALKSVTVDSQGNAWVASQGDDTIYAFRPNGKLIGGFQGGGVDGPWGITVDGEDNIWVANFGPLGFNNFTTGGISKLSGANSNSHPSWKNLGDPISPETGYTVHSAGSEVLLHDGTPLNGAGGEPSFTPLMRQTSLTIDHAGNIWSVNNWKPRFSTDILTSNSDNDGIPTPDDANPGGDGIIIFVGLAPPRPN